MKFTNKQTAFLIVTVFVLTAGISWGQAKGKGKTAPPSDNSNAFNRLMPSKSRYNLPPPVDGIHDATNEGTHLLQTPREAFSGFNKATFGNRVDWVKTLKDGKITPRWEIHNSKAKPDTLDLRIVRVVKGSMPDVLFPHLPHTQLLSCDNCHDSIFDAEVGKNQMSMAAMLMGKSCGVCHGKVAFPITQCRKCHAIKKRVAKK